MAAGEGAEIPGVPLSSPTKPSGWGRRCDDRRFTVLRRRDADGEGESGLLGRGETVGGVATRGLCALHLPKRTWIVKFDGKPIGYFYIDKDWEVEYIGNPLCTCMNGDIVVPSDPFRGYRSTYTYRSNQIHCWTFYPLSENSSVRSILTGSGYPIFLRRELEMKQREFPDLDINGCMDAFSQYISESGAGDSTSRVVNVDFAYDTTVMIKGGTGMYYEGGVGYGEASWLENGNRSLYGIFAPSFFESYRIYPFDVERLNTWVTVDGRSFCVGYRSHTYYASPRSPQGYETVRTSSGGFDDERPVAFYPLGSTFRTYESETGRGEHGWEIRYTNYPAGQGVLYIAFHVPVSGTYTSWDGLLLSDGTFIYDYRDYFDVRELNEHGGPFTRTDYVTARFSVGYDVETLEIERIEGMPREDENVTQDWFSTNGGRYLGTNTTTTTYPEGLESHITFERL